MTLTLTLTSTLTPVFELAMHEGEIYVSHGAITTTTFVQALQQMHTFLVVNTRVRVGARVGVGVRVDVLVRVCPKAEPTITEFTCVLFV